MDFNQCNYKKFPVSGEKISFSFPEFYTGKEKVLFVFDRPPYDDIEDKAHKLLANSTGIVFNKVVSLTKKMITQAEKPIKNFSCLFVCYSSHREEAIDISNSRLLLVLRKYRPTTIVTFGHLSFNFFNAGKLSKTKNSPLPWFGQKIPTELEGISFTHIPTFDFIPLVFPDFAGSESSLLSYFAYTLLNVFTENHPYAIKEPKYKSVIIDTIPKLKELLSLLKKEKVLSIDTETSNLNRIKNQLLTIQIAKCDKYAYLIPYAHKDTPFSGKELLEIAELLRDFFENRYNNYHIYVNAVFDLNILKQTFNIRFYPTPLWDIFAGEFALDENLKQLRTVTGKNYYSLLNISMQYGSTAYLTSDFSKENRATIVDTDLTKPLIDYATLDVIIPYLIHQQQQQRAKDQKYRKYQSVVTQQISDIIHNFSVMERNGIPVDVDYLFQLNSLSSPIVKEIEKVEKELLSLPAVIKANRILLKEKNVPQTGLFNSSHRLANVFQFDLTKKEHLDILFFNVMNLTVINKGKNGKGKLDKKFQTQNASFKEVSLYTDLQKAKKLRNAFVKQFLKFWESDVDFRHDKRIRPHFAFTDVVTGRTSANKPSLHQIPARSNLGKLIKRLFTATPGHLFIKVDFSAHEVRGWGIVAEENSIAQEFKVGQDLRKQFRLSPSAKLAKEIELKGDVHKLNAAYFFNVTVEQVDKVLRNAVKGVIFGLIYGMSTKTLASTLGKEEGATKELVEKFAKRFPVGFAWFDKVKQFAKKNMFVQSPLGRRRHLWSYLLPHSSYQKEERKQFREMYPYFNEKILKRYNGVISSMERRAVNSIVQGMASDFAMIGARALEQNKWYYFNETGYLPDIRIGNMVHDSMEIEVAYADLLLALNLVEDCLTNRVKEIVESRHNFKFNSDLEIDFEIGPNLRDMHKWDFSYSSLQDIILRSLTWQQEEMKYDVNPQKQLVKILSDKVNMSSWLKKQIKGNLK